MSRARNTREEKGGACGVWCGNLMENEHLDKVGVEGTIILNCIFKKYGGNVS
jgi:hypothetical protein